jgi:hypothetical protein
MSSSRLPLLFCVTLMTGLAGCGGTSNSSGGPGGGNPTNPGGNATTITYTFPVAPTAVATQIGTGPYTLATLTSGKLTLSIPSSETKFAVAYLCPLYTDTTVSASEELITQFSTLDGTSYTGGCGKSPTSQTGTATVQVNAAAIPGAKWVGGGIGEMPWSGTTLNFSPSLLAGTYDIPISASRSANFPDNYLAIRILRNQTVPGSLNDGAPVVFTASDAVQSQTITYANVPDGFSVIGPLVTYQTSGGANIFLNGAGTGSAGQYTAIPAASVQSGDIYSFSVGAGPISSSTGTSVGVQRYTSTGGPQSFTFPAPWSYAGPTPAILPTFNFAYSGFSNFYDLASIVWYPNTGITQDIQMSTTSNYLNGSTAMTIPDLSGLTGFLTPPTSGMVSWYTNIFQGNYPTTYSPIGTFQYVANNGAYTLP